MPWQETSPMSEKSRFIADARSGLWTHTEVCDRHGISRQNGYKWLRRFEEEGYEGLEERSRAPQASPQRMSDTMRALLLGAKSKQPSWGAEKVRSYLMRRHLGMRFPARSTVHELFRQEGLVDSGRRRRKLKHPGAPYVNPTAPNLIWAMDFKGQFRMGNTAYCYPLTVSDVYSRYLLAVQALASTKAEPAKAALILVFREHGLPDAILTDNGVPFCAANAIHGLSFLNVWWMLLGIEHIRIQPGKPQQNGIHERMHRTLKRETTQPPAKDQRTQQTVFTKFRRNYNEERPHQALQNRTPASIWTPSRRELPRKLPTPEYPSHFEVRKVSERGHFRFKVAQPHLAFALRGQYIGLEETEDGIWTIYFTNTAVARYDERTERIMV